MSIKMTPNTLRGYVTSRSFGGFSIPVPLQSLALRDYCQRHNAVYVLPVNENCFPHSYMVLESLMRNLKGYGGLVMYSIRMLPLNEKRRHTIYSDLIKQKCSMHFVLEDIILDTVETIHQVDELLMYEKLASRNKTSYFEPME